MDHGLNNKTWKYETLKNIKKTGLGKNFLNMAPNAWSIKMKNW